MRVGRRLTLAKAACLSEGSAPAAPLSPTRLAGEGEPTPPKLVTAPSGPPRNGRRAVGQSAPAKQHGSPLRCAP
eukprot:11396866-Alexandrium_andersonii.AAC.1